MKLINPFSASRQSSFNNLALLLMRLAFGGLMLIDHGWGKMKNLFGSEPIQFPDPLGIGASASLGLAVFSEVLCAGLIIIGLFTRLSTIPLIITMLVAIFVIHAADPLNVKEMAVLYLIGYLVIFLKGAGQYSVDAVISKS